MNVLKKLVVHTSDHVTAPFSWGIYLFVWTTSVAIDLVLSPIRLYVFLFVDTHKEKFVLRYGAALFTLLCFFGFVMFGYVYALKRDNFTILEMTMLFWCIPVIGHSMTHRTRTIYNWSRDDEAGLVAEHC